MRLLAAVLILAILQFCCQHSAHGSVSISLKSEVCPLEPVTVLCEVNSTSSTTKFGLDWSCNKADGTRAARQVTCSNSGSTILDLQCSQGAGSINVYECEGGRIVSGIEFGPNNTGSNITCADALNMTVKQSLSIEVEVPSSPELNYIRVENSTNSNSNTVVFELSLIPKNGTVYLVSVEPASPECEEPCETSTENTTISIPLQGNVRYNITSKALRCNGELNSTESKLTDFILQVPGRVDCNVTYENDEDILQADIQWNDVTVEPRNGNAVTSNVTTYEFMFHSGNKIIQNITLQRNDSFCSSISGMCDHKQSVKISGGSNITLFVIARNSFGIGPEKRCVTMESAKPKPPNGKSNSAMDVDIGIGIGIGIGATIAALLFIGLVISGCLSILKFNKKCRNVEKKTISNAAKSAEKNGNKENPEPMQEISKATPSKENSNPLSRQLNSVRIGVTQESPLLLSAQERTEGSTPSRQPHNPERRESPLSFSQKAAPGDSTSSHQPEHRDSPLLLSQKAAPTVPKPQSPPNTPDTMFQPSPLSDFTIETYERKEVSDDPKENTIETSERKEVSDDPKENFQIQVDKIPEDQNNEGDSTSSHQPERQDSPPSISQKAAPGDSTSSHNPEHQDSPLLLSQKAAPQLQPDISSNLPTTSLEEKDTYYCEEIKGISLTKDTLVCSDVEREMGVVRAFDRTRNIPRQKFKITGLSRPRGVVVFKNHIYVVESSRNRILKFDMEGNFVCKSPGLLKFTLPRGIAAMGKWIFVCNTDENEIKILNESLKFRFTVTNKKELNAPNDVALNAPNDIACLRDNDSEGYTLYVTNYTGTIAVFEIFLNDPPIAISKMIISQLNMGVKLRCNKLRGICIVKERYLFVTEMCSDGRILCLDMNYRGFCVHTIKWKLSLNLSYPTVIAHYEDMIAYSELDQKKSKHSGCHIHFLDLSAKLQ